MKLDLNVDVRHLTRVEGHANIKVKVQNGVLQHAQWEVIETPRYFEIMLKGRHYTTASVLTSRICGICSIAHSLASLEATEDAFQIELPPAAKQIRHLAKHAETLQSHTLHLFFLAAPDFLGLPDVTPLIESNPEIVALAARLKGLANRLCDLSAGRTTHPTSFVVGGVATSPDPRKLEGFRDGLHRAIDDLNTTADLLATFDVPDFQRETEYVATHGEGYPYIGRGMISTDGVKKPAQEYRAMTNEWVPEASTAKWCRLSRESLAVGPLARFNNNHHQLHTQAKEMAERLGLVAVCHNPFMNHVARVVECLQAVLECIRLIEELTKPGAMEQIRGSVEPRAGVGVGVVEAPRGILYHQYEYDRSGHIVKADCVIPTTQNHANIQHDLEALVPLFTKEGATEEQIELLCSMLVRAYDPCISCSVH